MAEDPPPNPDTRPLPNGWIARWEAYAQRWIYVNKNIFPEMASWVHPLGPPEASASYSKDDKGPPIKKEEES